MDGADETTLRDGPGPDATVRLGGAEEPGVDERIGRYLAPGLLGRGGMGLVLSAQDPDLHRSVALKLLLDGSSAGREARRKFLIEAQVTGQLEHPNIVPIHELGTLPDGRPYFTMKLVRGRSLAEVVQALAAGDEATRREFGRTRLLTDFLKICDAVSFAHDRGVVHRDLKPANVMIGAFGEVLVMDWGLAKVVGRDSTLETGSSDGEDGSAERTLDGDVVGTPAYMSPEQARGDVANVGSAADVYALGAILYEILTWTRPFRGDTVSEILEAVKRGEIEPPSARSPRTRIPGELDAVAMKALATAPGERYPSVESMREDIEAYLDGRLLKAAHYGPIEILVKYARRHRTLAAAAVLVPIVFAGVVLANRWQRRAERERELTVARAEVDEAIDSYDGSPSRLIRILDAIDRSVAMEYALAGETVASAWATERRAHLVRLVLAGTDRRSGRYALQIVSERLEKWELSERDRAEILRASEWSAALGQLEAQVFEETVEGDLQGAVALLSEIIAKAPRDARAYHERGNLWLRLSRFDRALLDLDRSIELDLEDSAAWFSRGKACLNIGRTEEALASFDRAIELAPANGAFHLGRGDALIALGRFDEAEAAFAEAAQHGWAAMGLAARGALRSSRGDLANARADFDGALEIDEANLDARIGRALVNARTGRLAEAVQDVDRVLAAKRDCVPAIDLRGALKAMSGDIDGAVLDLSVACQLDPTFVQARIRLGDVLASQGDLDTAAMAFERALELDPSSAEAYRGRGSLHRARGDLAAALSDLDKALEIDPELASAWSERAYVRFLARRPAEALADAERAIELDPIQWEAWRHKAASLAVLGRRDEALAAIDRAIELAPPGAKAMLEQGRRAIEGGR